MRVFQQNIFESGIAPDSLQWAGELVFASRKEPFSQTGNLRNLSNQIEIINRETFERHLPK